MILKIIVSMIPVAVVGLFFRENTKSDFCEVCGYDGEIKAVENEAGKLIWECPNCGNRELNKMSVVRRFCGYLGGATGFNQGRTQEIKERVLHL